MLIDQIDGTLGDILQDHNRRYWMRELSSSVVAAVDLAIRKRRERATSLLEDILDEHLGILKIMSLRHSATITGSRSWYRLTTWEGAITRRDVFHLPFERPSPAYRYSKPGHPGIYLGNNVFVCWLECNSQPLSHCKVARFEIDANDLWFLDLPANHATYLHPLETAHAIRRIKHFDPIACQNSPYFRDVEQELAQYLSLWPLLMACSVQKPADATAADPAEYIVSQFVADWAIKQKGWLGIRYFTTKFDDSTNSNDASINVVLPARSTDRTEGFCEFLTARVRCTPPQSFDQAMQVSDNDLFTESAADRRQDAAGRYWLHRDGALLALSGHAVRPNGILAGPR